MDADEDEFAEEIEVFKERIPLDSYQTRQEKSFTHSSNIVNIKLREISNLTEQFCGISIALPLRRDK